MSTEKFIPKCSSGCVAEQKLLFYMHKARNTEINLTLEPI